MLVLLICIPIIIYSPLWRYIADIRVRDLAVTSKKTTDVLPYLPSRQNVSACTLHSIHCMHSYIYYDALKRQLNLPHLSAFFLSETATASYFSILYRNLKKTSEETAWSRPSSYRSHFTGPLSAKQLCFMSAVHLLPTTWTRKDWLCWSGTSIPDQYGLLQCSIIRHSSTTKSHSCADGQCLWLLLWPSRSRTTAARHSTLAVIPDNEK